MHTHMLPHITHMHMYIPHQSLSAMLTFLLILVHFLQDDSEWPLVEKSLSKNKQLGNLLLSGCDTFLLNMGKALTENTSIWLLNIFSESL